MRTHEATTPRATVRVASVLIATLAAACAPAPGEVDSAATAARRAPCAAAYPLQWTPAPDAEARARGALAVFAPEATMSWAAARGTLASVTGLRVPLRGCTRGVDLWDALWRVAEREPEVFQLAREEWERQPPADCGAVREGGEWYSLRRTSVGGQPVQVDVFAFRVARTAEGPTVTAVAGTYLGRAGEVFAQAMASCRAFDRAAAEAEVMASRFAYSVFDYCAPVGSGEYAANAWLDAVTFAEQDVWAWSEAGDGSPPAFVRRRAARYVVNPVNYTPELLQSDANCPAGATGPDRTVGWTLALDGVSSRLVESTPGIGCVVCAH